MKFKNGTLLLFMLMSITQLTAQITVELSTLPDAGDVLQYSTFESYSGSGFDMVGEDMSWDFSDLTVNGTSEESYLDAQSGMAADSFPNADLLVSFIGNEGYALRNSTSVSVIGFSGEEFGGLPIPLTIELDQPFAIRRAPIAYGDVYNTQTNFAAKFPLADFPDLDTLISENNPLGEGVDIDSFAVTWDLNRTEEAVGWGDLTLDNGSSSVEVLQVLQKDEIETTIEAFIITVIGGSWIDVSGFLPAEFGGQLSINTDTYKYLTATDKAVYLEFVLDQNDLEGNPSGRAQEGLVTVNTKDVSFNPNMLIYPNPTSQYLNISSENGEQIEMISVYNANGSLVKQYRNLLANESIDVSQLNEGHYFVKVKTNSLNHSQRFTIVK